jgi:transposase
MSVQRKRYSAEMKAKIALEAIKGQKTANEIAAEYGVHPRCHTESCVTAHFRKARKLGLDWV